MSKDTCCFSGHRPNKLPWGHDEGSLACLALKEKLRLQIQASIGEGYRHFITGMAWGIDMYAAEEILSLKNNADIFLECAIPYGGQEKRWDDYYKQRYHYILSYADRKTIISNRYHPKVYFERNQYMVDKSSLLIAVTTGEKGGTHQTIGYAHQKGKATKVIFV